MLEDDPALIEADALLRGLSLAQLLLHNERTEQLIDELRQSSAAVLARELEERAVALGVSPRSVAALVDKSRGKRRKSNSEQNDS